jgi:hypothetical protein
MKSKCLDILNRLSQEDQDAINERIDQYRETLHDGDIASRAQMAKNAVNDHLADLKAERSEMLSQVEPDVAKPEQSATSAEASPQSDVPKRRQLSTSTDDSEHALELKGETEAEIKQREALQKKADDEKKAKDNAPSPEGFTLTGSNRPADVAEAHGQKGLFARKAKEPLPYDKQVDTPAFRKWFGASKVVDEDGKPLVVYHGTVGDFGAFDQARANIESDFGAGFYFSNTNEDVSSNYAGVGPDLENKIQMEVERLEGEYDFDEDVKAQIDEWRESQGVGASVGEAAIVLAREKFMDHEGATMPVYLRIAKPFQVGGPKETRLSYQMRETRDGDVTEKGALVGFIGNLRNIASRYNDGDVDGVVETIMQRAIDYGEVTASEIQDAIKNDEKFGYYTDENGTLASHEIFRQAIEASGFDGVIDHTANQKFGSERRIGKQMKGMDYGTVHYIAFQPEQIKSAIGNRGTFDKHNPDIRFKRGPSERETLSVAEVQKVADSVAKRWANAPEVVVIDTMDDAPKAVREENDAQLAQGAEGSPYAFFHDGRVYLVASEAKSVRQVVTGLFHESLGHYGLRGVFGSDLEPILSQLAASRRSDVAAKAKEYGLDMENRSERLIAAEEVLAELAQTRPEISFVQRAIAIIRDIIRKAGIDLELTDAEIIRNFIEPARAFVEQGHHKSAMGGTTSFHRAYHGSPHDFDRFDIHKIGTGEGAQAFGYGLYFAGKKGVAEHYRKALSHYSPYRYEGKPVGMSSTNVHERARFEVSIAKTRGYNAIERFEGMVRGAQKDAVAIVPFYNKVLAEMKTLDPAKASFDDKPRGKLYEVELAPTEDQYLDYNKTYDEQSPFVKKALEKVGIFEEDYGGTEETGERIYHDIGFGRVHEGEYGGDRAASELLAKAGIPGIKFLDGSSRTKGEGSHNYVIFDDKHVEVKAKFARTGKEDMAKLEKAQRRMDEMVSMYAKGTLARRSACPCKGARSATRSTPTRRLKRLGWTEYVKARMVKSADGALEGTLLYGKPMMDQTAPSGEIDRKGFLGAMKELKGEHDRFFMWIAGNRAERLMPPRAGKTSSQPTRSRR